LAYHHKNLKHYHKNLKQRKYKMKTIIATAIALTIATSASASWNNNNGVKWGGNTGALHTNGCSFKDQDDGVMTLDKATGKWTTTTAAKITVQSTGANNIKVTQGGNQLYKTLNSSPLGATTVDYKGGGVTSSVTTNNSNAAVNINTNEIAVGNVRKNGATTTTFTIGGTAQMADLDDIYNIDNDTAVYIQHNVTCLQ
jgi:hypothetical protein